MNSVAKASPPRCRIGTEEHGLAILYITPGSPRNPPGESFNSRSCDEFLIFASLLEAKMLGKEYWDGYHSSPFALGDPLPEYR